MGVIFVTIDLKLEVSIKLIVDLVYHTVHIAKLYFIILIVSTVIIGNIVNFLYFILKFLNFYSCSTRGHSWSLVVTRGHSWSLVVHSWSLVVHSWSLVVTRGHSWSLVVTRSPFVVHSWDVL